MKFLNEIGLSHLITKLKRMFDSKVDKINGKELSTNDFTNPLKSKLDDIETGANKYTHPTTAGNKHIPTGGTVGQILTNTASGTVKWDDLPSGEAVDSVNGRTGEVLLSGGDIPVDSEPESPTINEWYTGVTEFVIGKDLNNLPYSFYNKISIGMNYQNAPNGWAGMAIIKNTTVISTGMMQVSGIEQLAYLVDTDTLETSTFHRLYIGGGWSPWIEEADAIAINNSLENKVDKVTGKELSTNDFTNPLKSKLNDIEEGANKYSHPSTHPASIITESTTKKFVSDTEKAKWNKVDDKVDKVTGKGLSTNDYTTVEKNKLSGIATGANNYTHPSSHAASLITESSTKRFVSDTEKSTWNSKSDTDTVTTINGKTGAITKADIVALGIPSTDTNTTYTEITTSEIDAGTSTALRTITGRRVKYILDNLNKGGESTFAGNGLERTIAHGLGQTPVSAYAHPSVNPEGFLGEVWVRFNATNIYVGNTGSFTGAMVWGVIK